MPFKYKEVWNAGAHVASGHRAEWCRDKMRGEWDVVHLGQMRDLAALRKPTALRDIRHDDVRPLLLN